jgi:sodium-dependent dicarboxylate transporter 2/3/5
MLAVAYGASLGGVSTLVGTPTNLAFVQIFRDTYPDAPPINFGPWLVFALPYSLAMLAVVWWVLARWLFRVGANAGLNIDAVAHERAALGPMSREEKLVFAVFLSAALLWTFRSDLRLGFFIVPGWSDLWTPLGRLEDGTVAILLAFSLFLLPARAASGRGRFLLDSSVFAKVPWDILLLFGGGFALAAGFTQTGLSGWLAQAFAGVEGVPPWVTISLVCLAITFLTELTSNTATAQMFLPVLAAWASAHALNPLLLMVPAAISASMAFMLPVATPPNAIVMSSGRVAIFDMARTGFVLNLIAIALTVLAVEFWLPLAFDFDAALFPAWAQP